MLYFLTGLTGFTWILFFLLLFTYYAPLNELLLLDEELLDDELEIPNR